MGSVSIWHWVVVGVIVMLLFGRGKISDIMGDAAKGIKAFKKGMSEDEASVAKTDVPIVDEPAKPIASTAAPTQEIKPPVADKSAS